MNRPKFIVLLVSVSAFNYVLTNTTTTQPPPLQYHSALIGSEECLQGPSYWCQNFTTAKECNANLHCIRTVWEHQQLPPDNGEVCEICKREVAEARDMLRSNETQENLKLVLEGSCFILIPVKPLARECAKLMDQAIPQLIEALSSQMSPQEVCATAGLCNSQHFDLLIAQHKKAQKPTLDCGNCAIVAGMAENNFRAATRDHVLNSMLEVCGRMGSFSDSCSAVVIVNFNIIYERLNAELNPDSVCHLAGICQRRYHNHGQELQVKPASNLEGDLPCELCEQLVLHLRDVLVANTTEKEFEQVLLGLCQVTKSYKKECVDLVESYYPMIYAFLTQELDGKVLCAQIGICPKNSTIETPLYPLLPASVSQSLQKDTSGLHRVSLTSTGVSAHNAYELPLDMLVVVPRDKELCLMCEYLLHFLQLELTNPVNEQEVIKRAEKACETLPNKYEPNCRSFVDTYAAAVIALLAQDIDPSQVCPKIGVCPGLIATNDQCQSCMSTTLRLTNNIGLNTSEANVQRELLNLCLTLPYEISRQCSQVMFSHHEDLADMITAEFNNEEMCFFMKYCYDDTAVTPVGGDTETNEIPKTWEDEYKDNNLCVMCEFVMKTLEKDLEDKKTQEEIRAAVEHVCVVMPKTVRVKCHTLVDQYVDLIVTLLAESLPPKQVCQAINVCPLSAQLGLEYVRHAVGKCVACESLMGAMQGAVEDKNLQVDVNHQLEQGCFKLPRSMRRQCEDVVRQLAPQFEVILSELPLGPLVCRRIGLCTHTQDVDLVAGDRCADGQAYWCLSTVHAAACQKIEHCQKNVWLADKPTQKPKVSRQTSLF